MKYYKIISANGGSRFAVEQEEGLLADLTSVDENLSGLEVIARAASLSGVSIDQIAERIIESINDVTPARTGRSPSSN